MRKKTSKPKAGSLGLQELRDSYRSKKRVIRNRLLEFQKTWKCGSPAIFSELAFCLCTPQANAVQCDAAVQELCNRKMLLKSTKSQISRVLSKRVRFHKNKAAYIVAARSLLMPGIKEKLSSLGVEEKPAHVRGWLVQNVKGLGMKEATHFLRNIGFGERIAILDRHILRNLQHYNAIPSIPNSIGKKRYLEIEKKMLRFSRRAQIPAAELDLLFWSMETGRIFK